MLTIQKLVRVWRCHLGTRWPSGVNASISQSELFTQFLAEE